MTLVIYIPFNEGSLLISDRQNTYSFSLTRESVTKIISLNNLLSVVGFSGDTQKCRYLIDQLRREEDTTFEETYRNVYRRCYGSPELGFLGQGEIEFLVVSRNAAEQNYEVINIMDALPSRVDRNKCLAIGDGSKYILPQLNIDTLNINSEEAEKFGLRLIYYVSISGLTVGNPAILGYNVCFIETEIGEVLTRNPNTVDISRLLYRFD